MYNSPGQPLFNTNTDIHI